jgi:hypothetical protein
MPGVVEIFSRAFQDCDSLTEVYFPSSLERIERDVFEGCRRLASIYFEGGPPTGAIELRLPETTRLYRLPDAPGWGAFRHPNGIRNWVPSVVVENGDANGPLTLRAQWAEGRRVVWQTSQRLDAAQWEPVSTNQMVLRTSTLVDTSPAQAKRLYRVVSADP